MKSPRIILTEGALYVLIAAGSPLADFLTSDRAMTGRSVAAICIVAVVSGANALKAYLSQSMSNRAAVPPVEPPPEILSQ